MFTKVGAEQPSELTVGRKSVTICLKEPNKDRVCTKDHCNFAHIFSLDKITKGVSDLNKWTTATPGVKWGKCKICSSGGKTKKLKQTPVRQRTKVYIYIYIYIYIFTTAKQHHLTV